MVCRHPLKAAIVLQLDNGVPISRAICPISKKSRCNCPKTLPYSLELYGIRIVGIHHALQTVNDICNSNILSALRALSLSLFLILLLVHSLFLLPFSSPVTDKV